MASVAASLLLSKCIAMVYGPQTPTIATMSVTVLEESVDTQEVAQTTFSQMKGATGKDGQYSIWDDFRFKVVLPIASIFRSLSADEITQKALYNATCKVEHAFQKYAARRADLATAYIDSKQKAADAQMPQLKNPTEQAYWKSLKKDITGQVTTLEEFIQLVEADKEIKTARLAMLTGFTEWSTCVEDYLKGVDAEEKASIFAEARDDLTQGVGKGDAVLKTLRSAFAQEYLERDGITGFIDKLEDYVATANKLGLGSEKEVRDDLIGAVATYVNQPGKYGERQDDLKAYLNKTAQAYQKSVPVEGVAVQKYFQEKLEGLVNGDTAIDGSMLEKLAYTGSDLQQRPIYLGEFVGDDLEGLAKNLENIRLKLKSCLTARATYSAQSAVNVEARLRLQTLESNMEVPETTFTVKEWVEMLFRSDSQLNRNDVVKVFGKTVADELMSVMNRQKILQDGLQKIETNMQYESARWDEYEKEHAARAKKFVAIEDQLRHAGAYQHASVEFTLNRQLQVARKEKLTNELFELQEDMNQKPIAVSDAQLLQLRSAGRLGTPPQQLQAAIGQAVSHDEQVTKQAVALTTAEENLLKAGQASGTAYQVLAVALDHAGLRPQGGLLKDNIVVLAVGTKLIPEKVANEKARLHRLSLERGRLFAVADVIIRSEGKFKANGAQRAQSQGEQQAYAENSLPVGPNTEQAKASKEAFNKAISAETQEKLNRVFPTELFGGKAVGSTIFDDDVYADPNLDSKVRASVHTDSEVNPKAMPLSGTNILYTDTSKGAQNPIEGVSKVKINQPRGTWIDGEVESDDEFADVDEAEFNGKSNSAQTVESNLRPGKAIKRRLIVADDNDD
jgi:hypothetical protein